MIEFITSNWGALTVAGLAFARVIVSLTPTEKDNKVFGYIDDFFSFFITDRIKKKR